MLKNTKLNGVCITAVIAWVSILSLPLAAAPWDGSGTEDEPFQISDANDLKLLASEPNYYGDYHFILTADIDLSGKDGRDYIIAPDTDNSSDGFDGPLFNSFFEGNYHVIHNLTINTLGANDDFLGLFGAINFEGQVQNLGLESATVTGGVSSDYIGILAGGNTGIVEKCYASGAVTGGAASQYLGGLVGFNAKEIYNCYADVLVTGGASSQNVGGFVGQNYSVIENCYASGMASGGASVGGFAGSSPAPTFCYFLDPSDGGGPDNGIGIALLEEDMQDQASFATWDFFGEATYRAEIWKMNNFPVLGWQIPVNLHELAMLAQHWLISSCPSGNLCETVDWYRDGMIDINDLYQLEQSWMEPVVAINTLEIGDDFETGDFSYMPWVMGGDANFVIVSDIVYQGSYAAKSGTIGDSQTSFMEFTVDTTGYEFIGFYMKTSTEDNADKLMFYDNGDPHGMFYGSGELGWTYFSFSISSGTHTFRWAYEKNSSGRSGDDCVWIDKITFIDAY